MKKLILIALVCSALSSFASGYFGVKPIVKEPTCYGSTNGEIQLSLVGGTAPFQYSWSGGLPGTIVQHNIGGGSYSVTVTDANNMTTSYTIIVGQPYQIQISETHNAPQTHGASNGSIATVTDGGTPNYTYEWNTGATTPNISGLPAGTYTLTVTDEVGCTATATQTLTQPARPRFQGKAGITGEEKSLNASDNNSSSSENVAQDFSKLGTPALKSSDVQMFPNPANSSVTLKVADLKGANITVIDMNGQAVAQQKSESDEASVNVSGLPQGNYIIEIKTADGSVVNKTVTVVK